MMTLKPLSETEKVILHFYHVYRSRGMSHDAAMTRLRAEADTAAQEAAAIIIAELDVRNAGKQSRGRNERTE